MGLKLKLSLVILLSSLLSLTFLSFLTFNLTRNALQDATAKQQLETAKQAIDKIDRLLYERYNGVKIIASDFTIIQYLGSNPSPVTVRSAYPLTLKRSIEQLILTTGPWTDIDIVNAKGEVEYSTNASEYNKNIQKDSNIGKYVTTALQGTVSYSDVYPFPKTQKPTMVFVAPIHNELDPARPIIGAVVGHLSWPVVLEILETTGAYSIDLLNSKGIGIGDGNLDTSGGNFLIKQISSKNTLKTLINQSKIISSENNHQLSLASYVGEKGFLDYQGNNWILSIETPTSIAFAKAGNTATIIVIGLLLIILASSAILLYFMLRALRPLRTIGKAAHEIAAGDLTKRVPVESEDEIGQLAVSFNEMTEKLQGLYGGLEEKVAEKTQQLSEKVQDLEKTKKAMLSILEDVENEKKKNFDQAQDLKKFQLAVQNVSEQVIITDADGIVLYVNPILEEMTGWAVSEALGKKSGSLWGGLMDNSFYDNLWDTIKNKKQTFSGEIKNKKKDGTVYYVWSSISPITNDKGDVMFFVSIERDITKEKEEKERIEALVKERTQELTKEHSRLEASINNLKIGFLMTDINNQVILMNSSAKLMILQPKNLDEIARSQIVSLDDLQRKIAEKSSDFDLKKEIENCLQNKTIFEKKDFVYGNRDLHIFITPILTYSGHEIQVIGGVVLFEDITEEKMVERTRDEFFSIASHELRTPLTAIRGNSSLIKDYYKDTLASDNNLKQMVDDIYDGSIRLIEIVNDFLDLSRLEQGKIVFKKEEHDFSEIIEYAIREIQPNLAFKNLTIEYKNKGDQLPKILADGDRVKEIIVNLIGNAIKFTEKGGITVDATQSNINGESGNGFLKVSISDTGSGIHEENQKLLFRKFQQAGSSLLTRDTTRGTGLGLYISKLLVEGIGGKIFLEKSEVGHGTTFSFTIPIL